MSLDICNTCQTPCSGHKPDCPDHPLNQTSKQNDSTTDAPGVASPSLFAFVVSADNAEAQCIAFAETRNKARAMAKQTPWLWDFEWTEIKAKREPRADKWAGDAPELLDGSVLRSARIMHELGWLCIDEPSCEWCGAGQWDGIPESVVKQREDHDHEEICEGCYQHALSAANDQGDPLRAGSGRRNTKDTL